MTQSLGLGEVLAGVVVAMGGSAPTSYELGTVYNDLIAAVNAYTAGHQGALGHQGATGSQGAQGGALVGTQGAAGHIGAQGSGGAQGAQGAQGPQGHQGFPA